jgi:hypothetical protein
MPNYVIRNNNFRDVVLQVPYPFDAFFTGELEDLVIDNDVFLDAHFYFKTATQLPISITTIDGTVGEEDEISLSFSDEGGKNAGVCVFAAGSTRANVQNDNGVNIGTLVLDALGSGRLVSSAQGRYYNIVPGDATFHIDTCKVSKQPGLRYIAADGNAAYGSEVQVVARHGVQWSRNGDVLSLDLLGEDPSLSDTISPVLSVNGVVNPTQWLHNTPESNLRIVTDKGSVKFHQAKDDTFHQDKDKSGNASAGGTSGTYTPLTAEELRSQEIKDQEVIDLANSAGRNLAGPLNTIVYNDYDGVTNNTKTLAYVDGVLSQTVHVFDYENQTWTVTVHYTAVAGAITEISDPIIVKV